MKDVINETIERALATGKTLQTVQSELNSRNISIDLEALKRRAIDVRKKIIV